MYNPVMRNKFANNQSLLSIMTKHLMAVAMIILSPTLFAQTPTEYAPEILKNRVGVMALQEDGKVLIGGSFRTINGFKHPGVARLNIDGSLDSSFYALVNDTVNAIAIQADGKIIIAGRFSHVDYAPRRNIARLNKDGSVDLSFNSSPDTRYISEIVMQPDGAIIVVGSLGNNRDEIARLMPNGQPDESFKPIITGTSGVRIMSISAHENNTLLVAGHFTHVNGVRRKNLARLKKDGSLDETFDAKLVKGIENAVVLPDGKIQLSRQRLNTNGSQDTTFKIIQADASTLNTVELLSVQEDGKLLCATYTSGLLRLNSDGSIDNTFTRLKDETGLTTVLPLPNQKILISGWFNQIDGRKRYALARLTSNGTLE